ncbi:beta-lactamase family protein [Pyxidicoccus fallax]|uniref:Beta-lactamase family protein n=1 Tax=Pyxidicoccus fallax TaxID=394095 RepID=A0A848LMD1_9BACT|nr:serine hydrolase domain-containing protein [Pyxidicoccus fallax]NMO18849.1 beta-lactamase family protein [Pyxidicoccus fallax]NPC81956.1 beta-lactamase family protein [Pyxidicoccus fallax]
MAVLNRGLRVGMALLASFLNPACGPEAPEREVGGLDVGEADLEVGHSPLPPLNREALRQAIANLPDADITGAMVRVSGPGSHWLGMSGVSDVVTGAPVNPNGRFRIGSITKMFTATVVLQLAAERRVDLDRPVQHYLPGLLPAGVFKPITVRQVLNHTHGLNGVPVPQKEWEWFRENRFRRYRPLELVNLALAQGPRFDPGEQQDYGNIGYLIAGLLIEKVTGNPYGHEVRERILRPLGLRDTSVPGNEVDIDGPHARGYQVVDRDETGCPAGAIDYQGQCLIDVTEASQSVPWAAGEMISTLSDVDRFIVALFAGRLLPRAQMEELFTVPDLPSVDGGRANYSAGLARFVINGVTVWGKSGDRHGYNNGVGATRDLRRRLVFSVNTLRMGQLQQPAVAGRIIVAAMGGAPEEGRVAGSRRSEP